MPVGKHDPRPTPPAKPPVSEYHPKEEHSGQPGVHYGFRHEFNVKSSPHKSEMAHHFHASHPGKESTTGGSMKGHAGRPGDEKHNDEPG